MHDVMLAKMFALAIIVIAVVVAGVAGVRSQSVRQWRSRSWPRTQAKIESSLVDRVPNKNPVYRLTVEYSYSVNGESYTGAWKDSSFSSESDAQDVLKSLSDLPPPARYRTQKPSDSVMDPYADAGMTDCS